MGAGGLVILVILSLIFGRDFVSLASDPGDPVGGGRTRLLTPPTSSFHVENIGFWLIVVATDPSSLGLRAFAAAGAGGFLLLAALAYPSGMGMGDVKLAAFLGAWLGRDVAVALFVGTVLGALPAIAVLLRRGAAGRKVTLPYVPALAAGAVVALFFGDAVLDAWLG